MSTTQRRLCWFIALVVFFGGLGLARRDQRTTQQAVTATSDLGAFSTISESQISLVDKKLPKDEKPAEDLAAVKGKVLLTDVTKDAVIHPADVADARTLEGRLPLTVNVVSSPDAPGPNKAATLVASPTVEGVGEPVRVRVFVLRVPGDAKTAVYTVAITPADLDKVAGLLGAGAVRLLPARR